MKTSTNYFGLAVGP